MSYKLIQNNKNTVKKIKFAAPKSFQQKSIQDQVEEIREYYGKEEELDVGGGNTGQIAKNSPQNPATAPQEYKDPPGGEG